MGNKIELTVEQKDLFKMGSVLVMNEPPVTYYYFPFWIEENRETSEINLLNWNELPESLKNKLKELRYET